MVSLLFLKKQMFAIDHTQGTTEKGLSSSTQKLKDIAYRGKKALKRLRDFYKGYVCKGTADDPEWVKVYLKPLTQDDKFNSLNDFEIIRVTEDGVEETLEPNFKGPNSKSQNSEALSKMSKLKLTQSKSGRKIFLSLVPNDSTKPDALVFIFDDYYTTSKGSQKGISLQPLVDSLTKPNISMPVHFRKVTTAKTTVSK